MVTMNFINASKASEEIGCSVATVSRWAERLGITRRYGNSLMLTKREVDEIRKRWHKKAGNPGFSSDKHSQN
jgi:hypothetical protein